MNPVFQNARSQLAAALKEAQRLDRFEKKAKRKSRQCPISQKLLWFP